MIRRIILAALCAVLALPAGAQTVTPAVPPGLALTLFASGASVGNGADITEDILATYTLPAGQLANVGDRLHIVASGTATSSTDAKTARLRIGGIGGQILSSGGMNSAGQTGWFIDSYVVKTGASTQSAQASLASQNQGGVITPAAPNFTDTASQVIVVTGQNATTPSAGTITVKYVSVTYIRAPGT